MIALISALLFWGLLGPVILLFHYPHDPSTFLQKLAAGPFLWIILLLEWFFPKDVKIKTKKAKPIRFVRGMPVFRDEDLRR